MHRSKTALLLLVFALFAFSAVYFSAAQDAEPRGQGNTPGLASGTVSFTYTYPSDWKPTDFPPVINRGSALALMISDPMGIEVPLIVSAMFLVDASRAIEVFDQADSFPIAIRQYTEEPHPFVLDNRDAAAMRGRADLDRDLLIVVVQVEENLFLVSQTISTAIDLNSYQETIFSIAASAVVTLPRIIPTDTPLPPPQPTEPPRHCPYQATVTLRRLRVLSAEEARTGRDFGLDGDQSTLIIELGPVVEPRVVNPGTANEFRSVWTANLVGGEVRENIGTYSRDVCEDEFGLVMYAYEDDSTPFGTVLTPLGERAFYPLVRGGEPVEYRAEEFYHFRGESQDGNYDYEIVFSVQMNEQVGVLTSNLTPTLTPTNTFTPTHTFTPTVTSTPTNTFTFTPSMTYTASNTPTPSNTPTDTLTPSITPTPSKTYTPTNTFTPSHTPTPSDTYTPTLTPSNTPTSTASHTFTPTYTPSNTPTPSDTPTPSNTPPPTLTPTITLTPSNTPTPMPVTCPDSLPSQLYNGMFARVIPGGVPNRIRTSPSLNANQINTINTGEIFEVVGGPRCGSDNGYTWLEVRYQGSRGWTVESALNGYWVEPLPGAAAFDPTICVVSVRTTTNMRAGPGTTFAGAGQLGANEMSDVIAQSRGADGLRWYQLSGGAWMREDVVNTTGLCAAVPVATP